MIEKKTKTLSDDDGNPRVILCPGHVGANEFNKAFGREWSSEGNFDREELRYEYWMTGKRKWRRSSPNMTGAKPFTVCDWD